jgi:glutamyl-tRNA synthetase
LARLGWSHGDQEIFSVEEMVKLFDIRQVNKAAATFNPDKLLWLNQHYIKTLPPAEVATHLQHQAQFCTLDFTQGPPLAEVVQAQAERAKTLREMAENSAFFFTDEMAWDEKAVSKHLTPAILEPLTALYEQLKVLDIWRAENIHAVIHAVAEQYALKLGKIAQPLRVAVTGNTVSPPIDVTLYLIGQARCLLRIQRALSLIQDASG